MPDFIGQAYIDHMHAVILNKNVLRVCEFNLKKGGNVVMKTIMGANENEIFVRMGSNCD